MIEVNEWIFWGLCAMAGIGFVQALASITMKSEQKDWTKGASQPPGKAPEGFAWALVPIDKE